MTDDELIEQFLICVGSDVSYSIAMLKRAHALIYRKKIQDALKERQRLGLPEPPVVRRQRKPKKSTPPEISDIQGTTKECAMGDNLGPAKEEAQEEQEANIKKRAEEAKANMDADAKPEVETRQDR